MYDLQETEIYSCPSELDLHDNLRLEYAEWLSGLEPNGDHYISGPHEN